MSKQTNAEMPLTTPVTHSQLDMSSVQAPPVFALSDQKYLTQQELLQGLAQIATQYGKNEQQQVPIKRPKTMQLLTQEKSRKVIQYHQKLQQQRSQLKDRARRIVELFPKYIEKSGSKAHASFLFGSSSSERVFKEYQRLRFHKAADQSSIIQLNSNKSASKSFYGHGNRSIFEIPLSEIETVKHEEPYKDNFYQQTSVEELADLAQDAILNKDISMFQQPVDITNIQSIRESTQKTPLKLASQTQNDFLQQSLYESSLLDDSVLQLGNSAFEKNLLQLVLINQDLEGVVVADRERVLNGFQQRRQVQGLKEEQAESGQRRKLGLEEARSYYQWRQMFNQPQTEASQIEAEEVQIRDHHNQQNQKLFNIKRSKTSTDYHRRKKPSQIRALDRLQVQGQEARFERLEKARNKIVKAVKQRRIIIGDSKQDQATASLKSSIPNVKSTLDHKRDEEKCCFQSYCDEPLKLEEGLSGQDLCYISKENFNQGAKLVEQLGRDSALSEYKHNMKKKVRKSSKGRDGQLSQELMREINTKGAEVLNNLFRNAAAVDRQPSVKKDMSIDVQNSLRKSVENSEQESARKYFVRVPLFNEESRREKRSSEEIMPCCGRCFTIINYLLKGQ